MRLGFFKISVVLTLCSLSAVAQTWQVAGRVDSVDIYLSATAVVSDSVWVVGGLSLLRRTQSAGARWDSVESPPLALVSNVSSVQPNNDNSLLVASSQTIGLLYSSDEGRTWSRDTALTDGAWEGRLHDQEQGVFLDRFGQVWTQIDKETGWSWSKIDVVGSDSAAWISVDIGENQKLVAASRQGFSAVSLNGGKDWTSDNHPTLSFRKIRIMENGDLIAIVTDGSTSSSRLFYSTSDGFLWQVSYQSQPGKTLLDLSVNDRGFGYGVGESGLVVYTRDWGRSWVEQQTPISADVVSVSMSNSGLAIAASRDSVIYRYDSSATSVEELNEEHGYPHSLVFPNPVNNTMTARVDRQLDVIDVSANDVQGRSHSLQFEVSVGHQTTEISIDVSRLASGYHQLAIHHRNGVLPVSFVKQ